MSDQPAETAKPTYEALEAENLRLRVALAQAEGQIAALQASEHALRRRGSIRRALDPAAGDRFQRPARF